ncbi:hypothetical protein DFP72DRAFT_1002018 [Ephemerocybe angulata]|uniref:Uncharacterized protein n=1 Tax=Ephemerocybe angulata TaxID=980116 RepID=A0A8H6IAY3_9AGAR|nr:hypothetical protein DFP72DRAFT_1002018 [Tulosesus angulatus]
MPDHTFLFASLDSKPPNTARKVHIRRLYDLFQVSIQRQDFTRASRAWAILARCKEFDWMSMWMTGFLLLRGSSSDDVPQEKLEFLRTMLLQQTGQRESILQELLFCLIRCGKYREALNELELYLPAFPYQDNPILHTYAGLLCLYMAQPSPESESAVFDEFLLRAAQSHLDQSKRLDPENIVTQAWLDKVRQRPLHRSNHSRTHSNHQ